MTTATREKFELERKLTAAQEELVQVRGELLDQAIVDLADLSERVAQLERGQQQAQFRWRKAEAEKHERQKPDREKDACERARDRCLADGITDAEKYKAYLAEEMETDE